MSAGTAAIWVAVVPMVGILAILVFLAWAMRD